VFKVKVCKKAPSKFVTYAVFVDRDDAIAYYEEHKCAVASMKIESVDRRI